MGSSRVPPKEKKAAVACQWTALEGAGGTIKSKLGKTDQQAMAGAFGPMTKRSKMAMLLTEAFPIRGTSTAS